MKTCPVFACDSLILANYLTCHMHWKRLPAETRADLSFLHRYWSGSNLEHAAILDALDYLADLERSASGVTP